MTPAPGGDGGTDRFEDEPRDVQVDDAVEPDDAFEPENAPDGDEQAPVSVSAPDDEEPRAAGRWGRWAALGAAVLLVGGEVGAILVRGVGEARTMMSNGRRARVRRGRGRLRLE